MATSLLLVSHPAGATTARFAAFDLWPAVSDSHFFTVSSSQGLRRLQYDFNLSNTYVLQPLDVLDPTGIRVRSVIDYFFGHFISAGLGLTDFWQAGLTLPIFSRARYSDPTAAAPAPENAFRAGDLRLTTKVRVLDSARNRFGAALEPFFTIPLGSDDRYLGESKVTGGLKVIGDFLVTERVRAALNIGAEFRGEDVLINNINFNHRFLSGLGLSAKIHPAVTVSAEAQANTAFNNFFSNKDTTPVEFLGGVQWSVGQTGLTIGAGGGSCAVCGGKGAKGRAFLNIGYRRTQEKPREEAVEEEFVALGMTERERFAEVILAFKKNCPADPSDFNPETHDTDCPRYYNLREQVIALKIRPGEGGEVVSLSRKTSQERFVEVMLAFKKNCPADPSDFNPETHDAGCPRYFELRKKIIALESPARTESAALLGLAVPVHFKFNEVAIDKEDVEILRSVSEFLFKHPKIRKMEVLGYADIVGSRAANQRVSLRRAEAVVQYLKMRGIPEGLTLVPIGRGTEDPAASNRTPEGRRQNRRVIFMTIVK